MLKLSVIALTTLSLTACVSVTETTKTEIQSEPQERAEARLALGMGYLEQGNMIKARENLQIALNHDPTFYRAQLSMAHYYEKVGEDEAAEGLYKRALSHHPRNGNVLNNYGTYLCKKGEYEQADVFFNRAISQPYYYLISGSYENAAFCALKAGNREQSIEYFKRALDHQPMRYRSTLNLAKLEIEEGDLINARIRLMQFTQSYGLKKDALRLMVELEDKAGNQGMKQKYQDQLDNLS